MSASLLTCMVFMLHFTVEGNVCVSAMPNNIEAFKFQIVQVLQQR